MGESIGKNLDPVPKVLIFKELMKIGLYKSSSRTAGVRGRGVLVRLAVGMGQVRKMWGAAGVRARGVLVRLAVGGVLNAENVFHIYVHTLKTVCRHYVIQYTKYQLV